MKRTKLITLGVLSLFLAFSCEKSDPGNTEEVKEAELSLSEKELLFGYEGDTKSFKITANKPGYTISVIDGDQEWIHMKEEDKTVYVTVDENKVQEGRNSVITVKLEDVSKRVRVEQEAAPAPEEMPKAFEVPGIDAFKNSRVLKVMYGDVQVAQICREYLSGEGIDNQAIVAYPMNGAQGDMTKGFVLNVLEQVLSNGIPTNDFVSKEGNIHAGSVSFDISSNKISSYSNGERKASDLKFLSINKKGEFKVVESTDGFDKAQIEEDTCADADGNHYGIVKIGTQYWMSSDLRTTKTKDGVALATGVKDSDTWMSSAAYCESCFPELAFLYNATACGYKDGAFTDNISPIGFTIPSNDQFNALTAYLSGSSYPDVGSKLKTVGWDVWTQYFEYPTGGFNLSGFSACGVGYGNSDGTLAPDGNLAHVFYITSTTYDGGLGRYNVNQSASSFLLQAEGGCALGYAVRSIKK